jgi:hypothetical protein
MIRGIPYFSLLFVFVTMISLLFVTPSFAIVPEVRDVQVYAVGGSVYLNVTVFHFPEDDSIPHYVNTIEVTMGTNTTDLSIGVQPLRGDDTFTVQYDLGPVSGTSEITVKAHCIVNGWSAVNWTGTVPEFSLPSMLLLLGFISLSALFICRKTRH